MTNNIRANTLLHYLKYIFGFSLLILMFLLFAGNYENADFMAYSYIYSNLERFGNSSIYIDRFEPAFMMLYRLGIYFSLKYTDIITIIAIFGLLIIYDISRRFTRNWVPVVLLYSIYPFLIDIVQIRNFISMIFIFVGVTVLSNENKNIRVSGIIFLIIAGLFHKVDIIFLISPLLSLIDVKKLEKVSLLLFSLTIISFPFIYRVLIHFFKNTLYITYLLNQNISLRNGIYILLGVITQVVYSKINLTRISEKYPSNSKQANLGLLVYKISLFVLVISPIFLINTNISRIYRNTMLLSYLVYGISVTPFKYSYKKKYILSSLLLWIIVITNFIINIYYLNYERVFFPIFKYNHFL